MCPQIAPCTPDAWPARCCGTVAEARHPCHVCRDQIGCPLRMQLSVSCRACSSRDRAQHVPPDGVTRATRTLPARQSNPTSP
eukprot:14521796-Alexandrium_andersonii.AAC.1